MLSNADTTHTNKENVTKNEEHALVSMSIDATNTTIVARIRFIPMKCR